MKSLSTETLVSAYENAIALKLDREFIELIRVELIKRIGVNCNLKADTLKKPE